YILFTACFFLLLPQNGPPSKETSYVFNGDFVDRGKNSIEVLMILLVSLLVYPKDLHLNRGSYEDFLMNLRYDFTKEIMTKYTVYGRKILKVLEEVYAWLPIATVVDSEILILHGGVSEATDLNLLRCLERNKIKSVLMPPIPSGGQVTPDFGSNTASGRTYKPEVPLYDRLLRHEWEQGYTNVRRLVITVFSASNYYEEGSNQGAFLKLGHCKPPTFVQYQVTKSPCPKPLSQSVNIIENSAIRILKERMMSRKIVLVHAFKLRDHKDA
ncbi:serine/threonine-protein phosphatase with EF-hands 1-like, partial [Orycteropus afer afer]|uniref:Serine/threonine-protein phosphatase with EF-hands 1-like n=1 Tax=Orycteropus afer afer TaxID=1230840 RepID=A0AC54ZGD8_ORYAF